VIDRDELAAWLQLLETPRVGRETARRLLATFGSPQAVLAASVRARTEAAGLNAGDPLTTAPDTLPVLVDSTLAWLAANPNRRIVVLGDRLYPRALLETADPPLLLYLQGRAALLATQAIAVVGSRNPTPQGVDHARAFSAQLSQAGYTIVSGLALGIDAAAHEGALTGAGSTVAVVGTGLDIAYPTRNRDLTHRIGEKGLLVSEYPLGTPPLANNFPQRNRIIAGLARATLVVEAAPQSGSLITARLANEAGRDVLAIPGSIHAPQSRGCHALIKQGAKLVESVADILEELRPSASGAPATGHAQAEPSAPCADDDGHDTILAALGFDPVTLDTLAERTGWPPAELNIRLLDFELDGRVARLPGQRFQRVARG
jgi:DNA processing protein